MRTSEIGRVRGGRGVLVVAAWMVASAGTAFGQATVWIAPPGSTGFFDDPSNWSSGAPSANGNAAFIDASAIVLFDEPASVQNLGIAGSDVRLALSGFGFLAVNGLSVMDGDQSASSNVLITNGQFFASDVTMTAEQGFQGVLFGSAADLILPTSGGSGTGLFVFGSIGGTTSALSTLIVSGELPNLPRAQVGGGGAIEIPISPSGGSTDQFGFVDVGEGGRFSIGRPINDASGDAVIENAGLFEVLGDGSAPLAIEARFANGDSGADIPLRGTIALDLFTPSLSRADRLSFSQFTGLGGTLEISAPDGFVPDPGASVVLIQAPSFDPAFPVFDTVVKPYVSETSEFLVETTGTQVRIREIARSSVVDLQPPLPFDLGGRAADATVADFNGDGVLDLAYALPDDGGPQGSLAIVFGVDDAAGGFADFSPSEPVSPVPPSRPGGRRIVSSVSTPGFVASGDFDDDGDEDLASISSGSSTLEIRLNDGTGLLSEAPDFSVAVTGTPVDLVAGQFEPIIGPGGADGVDFAVISNNGPMTDGLARVVGFDGGAVLCDIDIGCGPDSGDPVDVDGAGASFGQGLAISLAGDSAVEVLTNEGSVGLALGGSTFTPVPDAPGAIEAADIDGDGLDDLSLTSESGGSVIVLQNVDDGLGGGGREFSVVASVPDPLGPAAGVRKISSFDADGDGDRDLVYTAVSLTPSPRDGVSRANAPRSVRLLRNASPGVAAGGGIELESPADLAGQDFDREPTLLFGVDLPDGGNSVAPDDLIVLTEPNQDFAPTDDGYVLIGDVPCPADINGDGVVTGVDFTDFIRVFSRGAGLADINGDGAVTGVDFTDFIALFAQGC